MIVHHNLYDYYIKASLIKIKNHYFINEKIYILLNINILLTQKKYYIFRWGLLKRHFEFVN